MSGGFQSNEDSSREVASFVPSWPPFALCRQPFAGGGTDGTRSPLATSSNAAKNRMLPRPPTWNSYSVCYHRSLSDDCCGCFSVSCTTFSNYRLTISNKNRLFNFSLPLLKPTTYLIRQSIGRYRHQSTSSEIIFLNFKSQRLDLKTIPSDLVYMEEIKHFDVSNR